MYKNYSNCNVIQIGVYIKFAFGMLDDVRRFKFNRKVIMEILQKYSLKTFNHQFENVLYGTSMC